MNRPWISVVMPTHEGAAWLPATLESLVGELDETAEILLIDSSADDRTADIARQFADRLPIVVERRPDVKSWTEKTDLAVSRARATHVAMLHQDDLWLRGRADTVRRWIAMAPEAALHLAPTRIVDANGRAIGTWRCPLPTGPLDPARVAERLLVQNFVSVPAPVFRRDAYLAVGGMDAALWYTADWDLWLKLARAGQVIHHRDATTAFRIHAGSFTVAGSRDRSDFRAQMEHVLSAQPDAIPRRVRALAEASIGVNTALAAAANGSRRALVTATLAIARLGPVDACRFLHQSRLVDRVMPRVRARLAGAF